MSALFYPLKRATLHVPGTGPAHDPERGHLFIILSNPCNNGFNVITCLNSAYPKCDATCLLTGGHKFIKHESFIAYDRAEVIAADILMQSVAANRITYEGLLDEAEFDLVFAGLLASPHTKPKVKKYFREFCL